MIIKRISLLIIICAIWSCSKAALQYEELYGAMSEWENCHLIDSVYFPEPPEEVFNIADANPGVDDKSMGFKCYLKVKEDLFYMYYSAIHKDEDPDSEYNQYPADYQQHMCFAYSHNGVDWIRGFPDGITAPIPGTNMLDIPYQNQKYHCGIREQSVCLVNDANYPFRMVAGGAVLRLYKSHDGVNWIHIKQLTEHGHDTQSSCIVRGDMLKIYLRVWTEINGSRGLRGIGVMYCDINGNIYSPPSLLIAPERDYSEPTPTDYYNPCASILDDRREILFPTLYTWGSETVTERQTIGCFIVDGGKYKKVSIDVSKIVPEGTKVIGAYPSIINIGTDFYLYYGIRYGGHSDDYASGINRRIKICFDTKGYDN